MTGRVGVIVRAPVLAFAVLAACAAFAGGLSGCGAAHGTSKTGAEAATRKLPQAATTPLALSGSEGRDSFGYPSRYVDKAALRQLLTQKRFAELTRNFEAFQARFEEDNTYEDWPTEAADAFASSEPQLLPLLNGWAAATPASFAPYLARATYWLQVGNARRGVDWAANTTEEQFAGMRDANALSRADIARALELRPKLMAAHRVKMTTLYGEDDEERRRTLDAALAICRRCYQVRAVYMLTLVPRWGGSYAAMSAFARESEQIPNPKLRLLKGWVDVDQASLLQIAKRYAEALPIIERACALGEHAPFLRRRAQVFRRLGRLAEAMTDLNRALALQPHNEEAVFLRAKVHSLAGRWELAARDVLVGLSIQPSNAFGLATAGIVAQELSNRGWRAHLAGRRPEAIPLLDLAVQLAPGNPWIRTRHAAASEGKGRPASAPASRAAP